LFFLKGFKRLVQDVYQIVLNAARNAFSVDECRDLIGKLSEEHRQIFQGFWENERTNV
jgi:hypothetical protein